MTKREFTKILDLASTTTKPKVLVAAKIINLDVELKNKAISHLVRQRMPIVIEFIHSKTDTKWLQSMGYLYTKKGKQFWFLCTSENSNIIK